MSEAVMQKKRRDEIGKAVVFYTLSGLAAMMCISVIVWLTASSISIMYGRSDAEIQRTLTSAQDHYALTLGVSPGGNTGSGGDPPDTGQEGTGPGDTDPGADDSVDAPDEPIGPDIPVGPEVMPEVPEIPEWATLADDGSLLYVIQRGDTLSKISALVGFSVDELAEYNHIRNVNLIYTGSVLRIPPGTWTTAPDGTSG